MKTHLFVVLGMHRSGTSLITRSLATLGASYGNNLLPAAEDNDKGFWEDNDIISLNDELLNSCGMTWLSPEPWSAQKIQPEDLNVYQERATSLLRNKLASTKILALKDPRISKLFSFWSSTFDQLDAKIVYIFALRSPLSVADSLMARDKIAKFHSYILWADYVLTVLDHLEAKDFITIEYEEMVSDTFTQVSKIANFTGLEIQKEEMIEFAKNYVETNLEHTHFSHDETNSSNDIPLLCRKIYSYLVSKEFEKASLRKELHKQFVSEWRNLFSNLINCQSFNHYIVDCRSAQEAQKLCRAESARSRVDAEQARAEAEQARAEAEQARAEAEQARAEAEQARAELMTIKQSKSWALTKPARKTFYLLKRAIKGS